MRISDWSSDVCSSDLLTIIAEAPKIGPHRGAMRTRIAEILALSPARISVKATTTERLGFTGRREGIAAQAIAPLQLPGIWACFPMPNRAPPRRKPPPPQFWPQRSEEHTSELQSLMPNSLAVSYLNKKK